MSWLRRVAAIRISVGALALIYAGVRIGTWATGHSAPAVHDQHLLAGFGWFVLAFCAPLAGLLLALRLDRKDSDSR